MVTTSLRRVKRLSALLAALAFLPGLALGQQSIVQGGATTAGHVPAYVTGGSGQPVVIDSGPAGGNTTGQGLSELNVTARCTSPPCAAQGTGVDGTIVQFQDAVSTNSTGYHYLAFSANALGGGLIEYGAGGTASALPFNFRINGTSYAFPFAIGGIVGPATTVSGNLVCWNNLVGTLVSDCGYAAGTSGNAVAKLNGNNTWSGTNTYSAATTLNGNVTVGGSSNFSFTGSSSGTTRVIPTAAASGVLTLPAATDTLVGKATTDTLTNKTYDTAGTGNSFSINGVAAATNTGTGAVARATSPSFTTPVLGAATATSINGMAITSTSGATLQLGTSAQLTLGNSKVVTFSQSMAFTGSSPGTITMPNGDGTLVYGGSQLTNSLPGDVAMNNTALYFQGPRVANGNTGTWFASGTVSVNDTGATNAVIFCKLWDGTTVFASGSTQSPTTAGNSISLSGVIASPASDIRISCRDSSAVTGNILFNATGNSKDSTLTVFRVL